MPVEPTVITLPNWNDIKLFLWYTIWAVIGGITPAVVFVVMSLQKYSDPIDWEMAGGIALSMVALSVIGCWRKHVALLKPPPGWAPSEPPKP